MALLSGGRGWQCGHPVRQDWKEWGGGLVKNDMKVLSYEEVVPGRCLSVMLEYES